MAFMKKIDIWNDTIKRCNSMKHIVYRSVKHGYEDIDHVARYDKTQVFIVNQDSIDCGKYLLDNRFNPVVLNMADNCFPGGHVAMGSGAQEEALFRRTNYFQTLNLGTGFYPLVNSELVYSHGVTVIKDVDGGLLDSFFGLSFIACPAIKKPNLVDGKFSEEDHQLFKMKVRNILNVAYKYGHDSVVLGAMGCGAWQCPQEEVAEIFKNVVGEYEGMFKVVAFAILEVNRKDYIVQNANLMRSNYEIFKRTFDKN